MGLGLVLAAVVLLTTAQVVIKARLSVHGAVPFEPGPTLSYGWTLIQDWKFVVAAMLLVISAFLWYAAVSRIPLSVAFPLAALTYPLIFVSTVLFLREPFTWQSLIGNIMIVAGVFFASSAYRS